MNQGPWSGFGVNYGNDINFTDSTYNATTVGAELDYIKQYTSYLRIGHPSTGSPTGIANTKAAALLAKTKGFYVIYGVTSGGLNDDNWATFVTAVESAADWAVANGIDEFSCGNEQDGSWNQSGTLTTPVTKILALGAEIKTNHFTGTTSYAAAQDSLEATWISGGKGSFDKLGYNVYGSSGSRSNFQSKLQTMYNAFTTNLEICEWNVHNDWTVVTMNDEQLLQEIAARQQIIQDIGISRAYFHTWHMGGAENDYSSTQHSGGYYREWWNALSKNNGRRWMYLE